MNPAATYPQPAIPVGGTLTRYRDLARYQRELSGLVERLRLRMQTTLEIFATWRGERDKRLGIKQRLFARSKWKAVRLRERDVVRVLGSGLIQSYYI